MWVPWWAGAWWCLVGRARVDVDNQHRQVLLMAASMATWEVFYVSSCGQLPARSDVVRHPPFEQDGLELRSRQVYRCGMGCWPRAHNDDLGLHFLRVRSST
jgi:hypothetical protein